MFFSETWLQPNSIDDNFLVIPSFSMHRRDRCSGGRGGGLLVYVKTCLSVCTNRRIDLEDESMECITLELFFPAPKHLMFFCYRPPDQSPELFFNILPGLLSKAEEEHAVITVLSDFYAKHPSWDPFSSPNAAANKLFGVRLCSKPVCNRIDAVLIRLSYT